MTEYTRCKQRIKINRVYRSFLKLASVPKTRSVAASNQRWQGFFFSSLYYFCGPLEASVSGAHGPGVMHTLAAIHDGVYRYSSYATRGPLPAAKTPTPSLPK